LRKEAQVIIGIASGYGACSTMSVTITATECDSHDGLISAVAEIGVRAWVPEHVQGLNLKWEERTSLSQLFFSMFHLYMLVQVTQILENCYDHVQEFGERDSPETR
jgi:hypothetical protein